MNWYFATRVTPISFSSWLDYLDRLISSGERRYLIGHHNLHSLYLTQADETVRRFYQRCSDCYIDGVPLCWVLSAAGMRTPVSQRFSLMDTLPDLLAAAQARGWTVFYVGSLPEVAAVARERFAARFPALRLYIEDGYFDDEEALVSKINTVCPDLLLVGMGMPLQERWICRNLDRLQVGVLTTAGGSLDYYAGAQARPPLWMSRIGLGGLYRLSRDPVRLGRRYLVEPWSLLLPTLKLVFNRSGS